MENLTQIDDLGVPIFWENLHIHVLSIFMYTEYADVESDHVFWDHYRVYQWIIKNIY